MTVSEDPRFLELRECEREVVWRGKEGATKDTMKIDLHAAVNGESLRFLDSGATWFREINPAKQHMTGQRGGRGV